MELNIGSNIISNSSGILEVEGKEQISIGVGKIDGQALLNADIYDNQGNHVAKLRRNAWVFNNNEQYKITTTPDSLKLIGKESRQIVFEAKITGKDKAQITRGKFYTHKGHLLEITPNFWKIGGLTMSGNRFDGCGRAVKIG